jgi:hypothetical protein
MKKPILPGANEPVVLSGGLINPVWYQYFSTMTDYLVKRGVLDMPDVDNSTPIANTQVLIFNSTSGKLKPGAN